MKNYTNDQVRAILAEKYNIEIGVLDVFPGTNPDATAEDVAAEIYKTLENMALGDFEEIDDDDFADEDKEDIKKFFAGERNING